MKKAIIISVFALLFCVFCACARRNDTPPDETSGTTETEMQEEETIRTRVPVVTSTLPPIPEPTTEPETTQELDDSVFRPETFPEQDEGTVGIGSDSPGYGEIGRSTP